MAVILTGAKWVPLEFRRGVNRDGGVLADSWAAAGGVLLAGSPTGAAVALMPPHPQADGPRRHASALTALR